MCVDNPGKEKGVRGWRELFCLANVPIENGRSGTQAQIGYKAVKDVYCSVFNCLSLPFVPLFTKVFSYAQRCVLVALFEMAC